MRNLDPIFWLAFITAALSMMLAAQMEYFHQLATTLVRDRGELPLEAYVHKTTGLTASHYGLLVHRLVCPRYPTDLLLFNAAQVTDRANFEQSIQVSEGINSVWVKGESVWDGRSATAAMPGEVLKPKVNQHG